MKRVAALVVLVFVLGVVSGVAGSGEGYGTYKGYPVARLMVNGEVVEIPLGEVPPFIMDGRVVVPLRTAAEALGVTVTWTQGTLTVNLGTVEPPDEEDGVPQGMGATIENAGISVTISKVEYGADDWAHLTMRIVNGTGFPVRISGQLPTATLTDSVRENEFNNEGYCWTCPTGPVVYPGETAEGDMAFLCWSGVHIETFLYRCTLDPYGTGTVVEFGPWTLE